MEKLKHVAIIMDGNGRWAKEKGLKRTDGHLEGVERVRDIITEALEMGIKYITFYAFSTENFKRPDDEKTFLFKLMFKYFNAEINYFIKKGARIRYFGDKTLFSNPIQIVLEKSESLTEKNNKINVNFALGYGSRQEIVKAINEIIKDGIEEVDEKIFSNYLYTKDVPYPDLVIRTSGEQRISNFLLYQIAYSEFYFEKKYWPDFKADDFRRIIDEFYKRNRRYGGV